MSSDHDPVLTLTAAGDVSRPISPNETRSPSGEEPAAVLKSKTFHLLPPHPNRIQLHSATGVNLGQYGDLNADQLMAITTVLATRPNGETICYFTFVSYTFQQGYRNDFVGQEDRNWHFVLGNQAGGVLKDYRLKDNEFVFWCGGNGARQYFSYEVDPLLYDEIEKYGLDGSRLLAWPHC